MSRYLNGALMPVGVNRCSSRSMGEDVKTVVHWKAAFSVPKMWLCPNLYTPHSFRISTATSASSMVPSASLKAMGC